MYEKHYRELNEKRKVHVADMLEKESNFTRLAKIVFRAVGLIALVSMVWILIIIFLSLGV